MPQRISLSYGGFTCTSSARALERMRWRRRYATSIITAGELQWRERFEGDKGLCSVERASKWGYWRIVDRPGVELINAWGGTLHLGEAAYTPWPMKMEWCPYGGGLLAKGIRQIINI